MLSSGSILIDKLLQLSKVREKTLKMWKDLTQTLALKLILESQVEFGHVKYRCWHSNRGNTWTKQREKSGRLQDSSGCAFTPGVSTP